MLLDTRIPGVPADKKLAKYQVPTTRPFSAGAAAATTSQHRMNERMQAYAGSWGAAMGVCEPTTNGGYPKEKTM